MASSLIPPRREGYPIPPFRELTVVGFGVPGSGKTRFFGGDPDAIFISTEPGQAFTKARSVPVRDWATFQRLVHELAVLKHERRLDCSSVVVDIVDNLHVMCQDSICQKAGVTHPTDKNDFGKTWGAITKEWTTWIRALLDITNVHFITHCTQTPVEVVNTAGLTEEINRYSPTFSGNKAAQYLDGIVNAMGFFSKTKEGNYTLSFRQEAGVAAKDRTDVLTKVGPIVLPDDPDGGLAYVSRVYEAKAAEMGFEIVSTRG